MTLGPSVRVLLSLNLHHDQDVVTARQRAAQIAALLGFDTSEQTRIATAVSEIVRNAFRYAGGGTVQFAVDVAARPQRLVVIVQDHGPGIPRLDDVLGGRYRSSTGMGMGIVGARRLMDRFSIESSTAGTHVSLEKYLPARAPMAAAERLEEIEEAVRQRRPQGLVEEIQQQNQELLRALDELQRKQLELSRLNGELEDTNRGVVALYAELDEKADHLRRADELKSRFLSNMTHEFRTPVNAIIGLCNLLIEDRQAEGRTPEPELDYIRKAADQLSELVNDLLDLAKVEAGKTVIRPARFDVQSLFGALRGMLRPLLLNQSVVLAFDDASELPPMHTDEAKVSQVLRNLISNALKYTERGEVRVTARLGPDGDAITFAVSDTGIGIAPQDQQRIFEEFAQVEHPLQRSVKGTGLGLPLSRRLAELLGGSLTVTSEVGVGSTFSFSVPIEYCTPGALAEPTFIWRPDPAKIPILVVEDARDAQFFYEKILRSSAYQMFPARSPAEAMAALEKTRPAVIVMDLVLNGEEAWDLLIDLKREDRSRDIPVIIVSALSQQEKGLALGADAYLVKPVERRTLIDTIAGLRARRSTVKVLTIDDEEVARYLVRQCLPLPAFEVSEAQNAEEGLRRARAERPDVIVLDLVMPGLGGRAALAQLHADPETRNIPVVISTAAELHESDTRALLQMAAAILPKRELSRTTLPGVVRQALARTA
jgi:signal transduction histidine kinase/CheY-like chemotaxis protein